MTEWVVPLADVAFSEDEIAAVADVYRRGWLSQGPHVAAFEAAFATFVGCPHAVALASCTAALHLSCVLLGLEPGDEVVLPALTFAATAAAVAQTGARPVFADLVSTRQPWLSCEAAQTAIGPRTRAIINVAYAGHPGEARRLRGLADARGLKLIEDGAHALGSHDHGQPVGTIGHAGAFSFFANKNLPLGEGGMLITADPELARRARALRSHGLSSGTWARHTGAEVDYNVLEAGFNYRLDEPRAALGTRLLQRLAHDNEARAEIANRYRAALSEIGGIEPAIDPNPGVSSAWHLFPVLLDSRLDRAQVRRGLATVGIQTSVHYPPLHLTTAFAQPCALPVTEDYARRTMTLPLFPHLSDSQFNSVVDALKRVVASLTR
jgi:dTDP-4-amino-4,6-dideoxygalactose transaminase